MWTHDLSKKRFEHPLISACVSDINVPAEAVDIYKMFKIQLFAEAFYQRLTHLIIKIIK